MAIAGTCSPCRSRLVGDWLAFIAQVLIAISFELADDLGRGLFAQHGTLQGIVNARLVVKFEADHDFWIEPAWQNFFLQSHHLLSLTIGWLTVAHFMNVVYVFGHVGVTLSVAIWVYVYRRRYFALLRNVVMLTNALALVIYESFPVAPPRLAGVLTYAHHPFTFQDTVFGMMSNGGRLVGSSQLTYNEFSALPSVHMAWALIVGATLVTLARPWWARALGFLYPALMLIAVVVTGNHFLLDTVASVPVVVTAYLIAVLLAGVPWVRAWPARVQEAVVGRA